MKLLILVLSFFVVGCGERSVCIKSHKEIRIVKKHVGWKYGWGQKMHGGYGFGYVKDFKDVEEEVDVCDIWEKK
jgi:hypothetical protein